MDQETILYIEDNYHNRRLVRKILKAKGYAMAEAEDGLSGLAMVRETRPSLILLDIGLPGMDGLEVLAEIKGDEGLKDIPVIAVTASAMVGDRERFLEAGCDDYLSKPVGAMELLNKVSAYLSSSSNGKGTA